MDFDINALQIQFAEWGQKPSHADRLLREFYNHAGVVDLERLKIGKALTERLQKEISLRQSHVLARRESADGTVKLLVGFERGGAVESVLMPTNYAERAAGCLSSQIGCAMGCDFCASTRHGLERNLDAGEIVEQFLRLKEEAARPTASPRRLSTVVFMGMGEPLLNLDAVLTAIRRIAGKGMGEIGGKQIMVSTVGIVPGIMKLAEADLKVTLALSLHAPDDATRSRIIPANKRYPVREIIAATKHFYEITGRVTNIEYCLLSGVNDSDAHARALADLLKGFRTHVNLIPYNATGASNSGVVYQAPSPERVAAFAAIVRGGGLLTHLRRARGNDVGAACGQLRETSLASGSI
ncbi:MAG TPA: 23S rRNA (adenine(2503)-C(2))-methyltransferase RlmN [Planctomycetota bacterium]